MSILSDYIPLLIGSSIATFLVFKVVRFVVWFTLIQKIPGLNGYHLLHGNLHQVPRDGELRLSFYRKVRDHVPGCRKMMRFWYGPLLPLVHVYHPELIKRMFKNSVARKPSRMGSPVMLIKPWAGNGLITTNLDTWYRNRKMVTPAFHFSILRDYCTIFNEAADVLLDKLAVQTAMTPTLDVVRPVSLCVLEGILRCALSYDGDVQLGRTVWMWPDFILRFTPFGRRFFSQCQYMHDLADTVIKDRRDVRNREGTFSNRRRDFVDMLIDAGDEDGYGMTDKEIRDEVNTFMAAGHHTTSNSVPWLLYLLAKHPDYQRRVQQEMDDILEGRDSEHVTWDDLSRATTLSLCAKESLRLFPPVPFIQRELIIEIKMEGYRIPKGTLMVAALDNLHRHPDVWERPDDFYPERFQVDSGNKTPDTYANIPFAAGPRNCIGQNFAMTEAKVIVSRLLHKFNMEIDPKAPEVKRAGLMLLESENGVHLKFTKRDNGNA